MEERYWEQFMTTGKIDDYLSYKGFSICAQVMDKYSNALLRDCTDKTESKGQGSESGNSYRNGTIIRSYR